MKANRISAYVTDHTQTPARALTHHFPHQTFRWAALVALAALTFEPQPTQAAVTEAWVHRYSNVVSNSVDQAFKVVSDAAGDIIVTGTSDNGITGTDILTIKYSGTDGSMLWQRRYNGPSNGNDFVNGVALDGSGNVAVVGTSPDGGSMSQGGEYYTATANYAAADGAILWEKRGPKVAVWYSGSANRNDSPTAVAVDRNGDVVVTGLANRSGSGEDDVYTAKYAAADGVVLWEKHCNSPANGDDPPSALAVDSKGNAVVTGNSQGDFYTAKYAGGDGTLVWEKRGPVGFARAVRLTGSGDVVVTGQSWNSAGTSDYYTAKYASADGALFWEKRYNGPANKDDYVSAMAIGPDGRVAITGSSDGNFYWRGEPLLDYATVVYREALSAISVQPAPSGTRLAFTGTAGQSYSIQRAPAVTGPWNTINTQTAPASGLLEYLESNPPVGAAFYRTSEP